MVACVCSPRTEEAWLNQWAPDKSERSCLKRTTWMMSWEMASKVGLSVIHILTHVHIPIHIRMHKYVHIHTYKTKRHLYITQLICKEGSMVYNVPVQELDREHASSSHKGSSFFWMLPTFTHHPASTFATGVVGPYYDTRHPWLWKFAGIHFLGVSGTYSKGSQGYSCCWHKRHSQLALQKSFSWSKFPILSLFNDTTLVNMKSQMDSFYMTSYMCHTGLYNSVILI